MGQARRSRGDGTGRRRMAVYLTVEQFKTTTLMPVSFVNELETSTAGFVLQRLTVWSAQIDIHLRKRYAAPFGEPYPIVVQEWLAALVTLDCWLKRGISATDEQWQEYRANAQRALDALKEAADAVNGLYDLPLRDNQSDPSAISRGGSRSYSEATPYKWTDVQEDTARDEANSREGTTR